MKVEGILQNNGVINDHSGSVNTLVVGQDATKPDTPTTPHLRLKTKGIKKLDFLRVLVAMHESGYFTDRAGSPVDLQDVLAAFADILGDNFDRASSNLSDGLNHYNQEIRSKVFDNLKETYIAYEDKVLKRREENR